MSVRQPLRAVSMLALVVVMALAAAACAVGGNPVIGDPSGSTTTTLVGA